MRMIAAKTGLFLLTFGIATSLTAGDATTTLLNRLHKGDCLPSSLAGAVWTITTSPVGTHGALDWGDQLVFEQATRTLTRTFDQKNTFTVSKNGVPWRSVDGWTGACVRNENLGIYVITGTVELNGCLHDLAFGRLDHDDSLGNRIEVIFEHAEDPAFCGRGHEGDAVRHPGHAHGDHD